MGAQSPLLVCSALCIAALLLSLAAAAHPGAHLTECDACVAAGFGWSAKKGKCGGYKSAPCPPQAEAPGRAGVVQGEVPGSAPAEVPEEACTTEPEVPVEIVITDTEPKKQRLYGLLPVTSKVKSLAWDHSDPDFSTTLALRNKPTILTDSPHLQQWGAASKWSPKFLEEHVDKPMQFSHNPHGQNFLFYKDHGVDQYNSSISVWRPPSQHKKLTVKAFNKIARKAMKKKQKEYMYYYKNVGPNTPFKALLGDITPYSWFVVDRASVVAKQGGRSVKKQTSHPTAVMWFGMKGVRSTIHYDESYNFYIQIFGTKRWYFAPPEYYSSCYLYPMAHPSTRQCQLDWPHTNADRYPFATSKNASEGGGMELMSVVLKEGEVLFIPPGWFHATEALDTNLAMNYWSKGINAQQHWMDLSLDCDKQWKMMRALSSTERKITLLNTLFQTIAFTLLPGVDVSGAASSKHPLMWWMEEGPLRVAEVLLVISERFNQHTADGFKEYYSAADFSPASSWVESPPMAQGRYAQCLTSADTKMSSVMSELGIEKDTVEARILLGDMAEGLGRGMLSNLGVGPFFVEVREVIAKVRTKRFN